MNNLKSNKKVRTRIAPSPTGFPHIGTIYQALFNYSWAKKNNGNFIVRIEDTDRKRFVEGAEEVIFNSLDWFNLIEDESPRKDGDKGPYRQSEKLEVYKKYAEELIYKNHAYYCFCSKERLDQIREKLQKEKKQVMYDKYLSNLSKTNVEKKLKENSAYVIRLKVPENQKIIVKDEIRGDVTFDSNTIDDQVLIKSDGFPTYHLAAVVDDHLMQITHVIRAEEWLSSTPKHFLLYDYFGWEKPLFYHTPDIRNPDKSKLSKRHGHTNVNWYIENGFLPEAILNFLALLGWSHPDEKEIFPLEEFIKLFNPKDLKPVGPIFDVKKLEWMNGVYIRNLSISNFKFQISNFLGDKIKDIDDQTIDKFIPLAQTRMKTLNDFYDLVMPFFDRSEIVLSDKEKKVAETLLNNLSTLEQWNNETILFSLKKTLEEESAKMPVIYKILTGKESGLPLSQTLEILDKEKVLNKLK